MFGLWTPARASSPDGTAPRGGVLCLGPPSLGFKPILLPPSATLPSARCSRQHASSQDAQGTCPTLSRQPPSSLSPDQEHRPFVLSGSEERASQRSWYCKAPAPGPSSNTSERPRRQGLHGTEAKLLAVRNSDLSRKHKPILGAQGRKLCAGALRGLGAPGATRGGTSRLPEAAGPAVSQSRDAGSVSSQ